MLTIDQDNLLYKLESLAGYEPDEIDDDDFDLGFQTSEGCDSTSTESIVDIANQAVILIRQLSENK